MAKRNADFKARAISQIPDAYRTDKIRYSLPAGWTMLRPESPDDGYLNAGLLVAKDIEAASTAVHVFRPIVDCKWKGTTMQVLGGSNAQLVVVGTLMLEAKAQEGAIERGSSRHRETMLPSGLRVYEAEGRIDYTDGSDPLYAQCSLVEADHQLQPFCAAARERERPAWALRPWLETMRPGDGVPLEHVIRYGGDVSYVAPNSWEPKIIDDGAVMQLFPVVEHDRTLKRGEHSASGVLYLPTVWNKSASEYLDQFIERFFDDGEKHHVSIEREAPDHVVAKMVWHQEEKPGGHQALCVSTVEHGLAQIACFFAESDAAMKEHGEAGRRFIESVAVVRDAVRDQAPCRPSHRLPQPIRSTEI
jgi:hypothetical protein